jgi:di/tricarboxylate transporter
VAVIAAWSPQKHRGVITMAFATLSVNLAHILGAQGSAVLLKHFEWGTLFIIMGGIFFA